MNRPCIDPIVVLLEALRCRGIFIEADGHRLRVWPRDNMTEELALQLAKHESELVTLLTPNAPEKCEATYGAPGKTWADRAARLLNACPPTLPKFDLEQLFEETAGILEFGQGWHIAQAEMHAFGLLLFRILELGFDARTTP